MTAENIRALVIERDIPVPARRYKGNPGYVADAFKKMQPGDSVFVPSKMPKQVTGQAHHAFGAGNYTCRAVDGGVRVWRTK